MALAPAQLPYSSFRASDADFERVVSVEYKKCEGEAAGVTAEMRDCSAAEFDRLDAQLNDEYREAMLRSRPSERAMLRQLQRRWLATRWRECDLAMAKEEGGTLALLIGDGCRLTEMARRILWLERYGL